MANPWIGRRVLSYAHQGGAYEAPSSTLFAVESALSNGADGIELDLHPTFDGDLVCMHDESLDRTTDHSGLVRDMTVAELRAVDAAYYFVPNAHEVAVADAEESAYVYRGRVEGDPRFGIPSLVEMMDACEGVFLNLDIKEDLGADGFVEEKVGSLILERSLTNTTIVASFLQEPLDRFREIFPMISTSASPEEALGFYQSYLAGERPHELPFVALQIPAAYGGIEYVDAKLVSFAHECGVAVHVWTINDEAQMERLISYGVDGLMSDRPSLLHSVLERTAAVWRGNA